MRTLPCGHAALEGDSALCAHLLGESRAPRIVQVYRGDGLRCDFVCGDCAADDEPALIRACEGCVQRTRDREPDRLRGWASVAERPTRFRMRRLGSVETGWSTRSAWAPYENGWYSLGPDRMLRVHDENGSREIGKLAELPGESADDARKQPELALHAARDGSAVAMVRDYGRYGVLADASDGSTIRPLDRGDYHADVTRFPCAFARHAGRAVLLAGTDWNRVDAFDAATGTLLTERGPTSYAKDEPRPEHYLDYFHGALHVSPGGTDVVSDGWAWHPVGMPLQWSVAAWLDGDTWQAEEAEALLHRGYLWDVPTCWLDDERLVVWGVGGDDDAVLPGATVLGDTMTSFAGVPRRTFWSDGSWLFVNGDTGLTVWDPVDGVRLAELVGFTPLAYNAFLDEFVVSESYTNAERVRLTAAGK